MERRFRPQAAVVGLIVGLGCLALLLRQVDLKQSWSALGQLRGEFMLVPLAIFFINLPLRARRWQLIFPAKSRPSLTNCLTVLGIGNMANFLLPGRAGDLARCVLLENSVSLAGTSRTLATLAVEKVLDGLALVGMVLVAIWALHPPYWLLSLLRIAIVIFGGVLVLLVLLRHSTEIMLGAIRRIFAIAHLASAEERLKVLLAHFVDGLSGVSNGGQMLGLFFLTAAIWASEACLVWGLAMALTLAVPLKSAAAATAVLGLGLMIPAAPGGLGTYELFGTESFKLAGVAAGSALALTVVIHAWVFVTNVALGICLLTLKGVGITQLRQRLDASPIADTPHDNPSNATDLIES